MTSNTPATTKVHNVEPG